MPIHPGQKSEQEIGLRDVRRSDVDRHAQMRQLCRPCRRHAQRLRLNMGRERQHEVGALRRREQQSRAQLAIMRVVPAGERLHPTMRSSAVAYCGLKDDLDLIGIDGEAQVRLQPVLIDVAARLLVRTRARPIRVEAAHRPAPRPPGAGSAADRPLCAPKRRRSGRSGGSGDRPR